jgi:hypothetical protein
MTLEEDANAGKVVLVTGTAWGARRRPICS